MNQVFILFIFLTNYNLYANSMTCESLLNKSTSKVKKLIKHNSFDQIKNDRNSFTEFYQLFKNHNLKFGQKSYRHLFSFSEKSNLKFVNESPNKKGVFVSFENSKIKILNDEIWGKEITTQINFMAKKIFIKNILKHSLENKDFQLYKTVWNSLLFEKHNDFKSLNLFFPENIAKKIIPILEKAYFSTKMEMNKIITNNSQLYNNKLKDKNSPIEIEHIFNAIYDSNIFVLRQTMKKLRSFNEPYKLHRADELLQLVHMDLNRFYHLHDMLVEVFSGSNVLNQHNSLKYVKYFNSEFFGKLRKVKINPRDRNSDSDHSNRMYQLAIANLIFEQYGIKLHPNEVKQLIEYYHLVQDLTPQMLHVKTLPNSLKLKEKKLVISSDIKSAGGIEMSNIVYFLLTQKNNSLKDKIKATNNAVDFTTLSIKKLFHNLKNYLQKELELSNVEISGDDLLSESYFTTKTIDLSNIATLFYAQKNITNSLRSTIGIYSKNEDILAEVEKLEKIEKLSVQEISKNKSWPLQSSSFILFRPSKSILKVLFLSDTANKLDAISIIQKLAPEYKVEELKDFSPHYHSFENYNFDMENVLNKQDYLISS